MADGSALGGRGIDGIADWRISAGTMTKPPDELPEPWTSGPSPMLTAIKIPTSFSR